MKKKDNIITSKACITTPDTGIVWKVKDELMKRGYDDSTMAGETCIVGRDEIQAMVVEDGNLVNESKWDALFPILPLYHMVGQISARASEFENVLDTHFERLGAHEDTFDAIKYTAKLKREMVEAVDIFEGIVKNHLKK